MKNAISKKLIIAFVLVALVATACFACAPQTSVAFATEYGSVDSDSLWYYGEGGLDIAGAKAVVDNWDKSRLSKKVIAVIDTGIDYAHELFEGVLYTNAEGNHVGYDAREKKEIPLSQMRDIGKNSDGVDNKHGNAISGMIAMAVKELGLQDYIKIYPIKANTVETKSAVKTETNKFSVANVTEALKQAGRIGADAVNMSLGRLKNNDKNLDWATDEALINTIITLSENTVIVAAAGNDGKNSSQSDANLFYPATHDGVIGVMAYARSGLYSDSNFGSAYDIAGPGEDIYTAKYADTNTYQTMKGTSLASPLVCVASVLIKLRYEAEGKGSLSGTQTSRFIRNLNGRTVSKDGLNIRCLDFKTALTQDFDNTQFIYDDPTELQLSHDGEYGTGDFDDIIYQRANTARPITFIAKINPYGKTDPAVDNSVQWILQRQNLPDQPIGSGLKLEYMPSIKDETVMIIAKLQFGEKVFEQTQLVHLSSVEFHIGEARVTYLDSVGSGVDGAPSEGVLYTRETTVFSLTGIEFVSDKKVSEIKWYVDGEFAGEGKTFEYSPKTAGKHVISARFDDKPIPREFIAEVKPFIARPLDLSMLIIGLLIATGAIVTGIAVLIKRKTGRAVEKEQSQE